MGKIESALLNYDLNSNFTHNELNQAHEKINKKLKHNTFVTVTITKVDYPYCLAK